MYKYIREREYINKRINFFILLSLLRKEERERESKNVTNKRFTRNQRIFKKQKTK